MRRVGEESSKTWQKKMDSGFFDHFMSGTGLDIGYAGYIANAKSILPSAIGIDTNYPGYDGRVLPFASSSQDFVYTSHTLEHIDDYVQALREWYRVLKVGGHMVIAVPSQYLYEKKASLPSRWNADHKRFYTVSSLAREIEEALEPNSYRVELLRENAQGWDKTIPADSHSGGEYEIEMVIKKVNKPDWELT